MAVSKGNHSGRILAQTVREMLAEGQTDYSFEPVILAESDGYPRGASRMGMPSCSAAGVANARSSSPKPLLIPTSTSSRKSLSRTSPSSFSPCITINSKTCLWHLLLPGWKKRWVRVVSQAGSRQVRISESEKFAHVTFFFNGGNNYLSW